MAIIPKVLHEHINTAFPDNVTLVGTALPDGYAQITPRGGTMVYDDQHLAPDRSCRRRRASAPGLDHL